MPESQSIAKSTADAVRLVLGVDTCGPSGSVALVRIDGQSAVILAQKDLAGRTYSATLVSNAIYDVLLRQSDKLGVFGHGYTYSAHPVPAAVALETLRIYEERDLVGHVRRVGPRLQVRRVWRLPPQRRDAAVLWQQPDAVLRREGQRQLERDAAAGWT